MTAVEYLVSQLKAKKWEDWNDLIQQALEMEKEQIIGAYLQAKMENLNMPDSMKYYDILEQNKIKAEEHYNETYK